MEYKYTTPKEAILSLELAYTNKDIDAVIASKDFMAEARLVLNQASYKYDVTDKSLLTETAKLLEMSLINSLAENGFPNFEDAERKFTHVQNLEDDIYILEETISYPDGTSFVNKVFLSNINGFWKVAMIEE